MRLVPVLSRKQKKRFITFPAELYKNNKTWIRPIDQEIEDIFDPSLNKTFKYGDCRRWLLEERGKVIGRIAAFYIEKKRESGPEKAGGIGYFECVDSQQAADVLFDVCRDWLLEQGATYMDGPINFGRRDKWWGLLTKGFELEPNYQFNYNFPYYKDLFEGYGFQLYFEQFTFVKVINEPLHPRLRYKAEMVAKDSNYTFENFNLKEISRHAADIFSVYNKAWVNHEGVSVLSQEQGEAIIKRLKPIMDEEVIWIAYYKKEPVAIFVNIPEVNQIMKHVNGKLDLLGKLKFLWHKKRGDKLLGTVFGVVPEHQGKGVDGAIIHACDVQLKSRNKYKTIEMGGIGDFNRKMILVAKQVGGSIEKVHTTYRYLFDRTQLFERMKSI